MEKTRRGPFRPTTQRFAAVRPSGETRRAILLHALTRIIGNELVATQVVADAVGSLGLDEVPEDASLYELLVRAYVAPAALKFAPGSSVQSFVDAALGRMDEPSSPVWNSTRARR